MQFESVKVLLHPHHLPLRFSNIVIDRNWPLNVKTITQAETRLWLTGKKITNWLHRLNWRHCNLTFRSQKEGTIIDVLESHPLQCDIFVAFSMTRHEIYISIWFQAASEAERTSIVVHRGVQIWNIHWVISPLVSPFCLFVEP